MPASVRYREEMSSVYASPKRIVSPASSSSCRRTQTKRSGQSFPARHVLPSCCFSLSWTIIRVGPVNQEILLVVVWHDRCLSERTGASETKRYTARYICHCQHGTTYGVLNRSLKRTSLPLALTRRVAFHPVAMGPACFP